MKEGYLQLKIGELNDKVDKINENFESILEQIKRFEERLEKQREYFEQFKSINEFFITSRQEMEKVIIELFKNSFHTMKKEIYNDYVAIVREYQEISKRNSQAFNKEAEIFTNKLLDELVRFNDKIAVIETILVKGKLVSKEECERLVGFLKKNRFVPTIEKYKEQFGFRFETSTLKIPPEILKNKFDKSEEAKP